MGSPENACFHCGEPIPDGVDLTVSVDGTERAMCCAGCQAVTQLIFGSGLGRYYQFRQELGRQAGEDMAAIVGDADGFGGLADIAVDGVHIPDDYLDGDLRSGFQGRADVFPRHDQEMIRSLGVDIFDNSHPVILVNNFPRDIPGDYLTKDAIVRHVLLLPLRYSSPQCRRPAEPHASAHVRHVCRVPDYD